MPSKKLTLFILVFVVVAVWALSQEDWKRDVPYAPANSPLGGMMQAPVVLPDILQPGDLTAPGAGGAAKPVAGAGTKPVKPVAASGEAGVDIMSGLNLIGFSSKHGARVPKSGVLIIKIKKNGEIVGRGVKLGEPEMVVDLVRSSPGQRVVILPDKDASWDLVERSVASLMKSGAVAAGIGYKTGGKPMMLALPLPTEAVAVPEGMDIMKLTVKKNETGAIGYHLYEYDCENMEELAILISDLNAEMAETFDGKYSRNPAKTPWVVTAEPGIPAGEVVKVLAALRDSAVYTVRIGE